MNGITTIGAELRQERFNRRMNKVMAPILFLIVAAIFTGHLANFFN